MSPGERPRATLLVLFSVVIVDLIGFGVVMPILPFWAREFGASGFELGGLLTAYAVAQFVCAPLWGRLSDRVGRRPVMLTTIAGTTASLMLLALAPSFAWVFAARLLAGGFAANVSVATAYVADVTPPEERTRWMGMIGASFGVGFLLGPALGWGLVSQGVAVPLFVAAGLSGLNLAYAMFVLREPARHQREPLEETRLGVLRLPGVFRLCLANFGFSGAVTQLETVFAFLMLDHFTEDKQQILLIMVGMAVIMVVIQGGGMRALSARFRESQLVVTGALLLAVSLVIVPYSAGVAFLLVPLAGAAVGRAIAQPSMMSMVSLAAGEESRGAVMGTFQSSASLARVVGPLVAGLLYDLVPAWPFLLAGALLIGVAALQLSAPTLSADRAPA